MGRELRIQTKLAGNASGGDSHCGVEGHYGQKRLGGFPAQGQFLLRIFSKYCEYLGWETKNLSRKPLDSRVEMLEF